MRNITNQEKPLNWGNSAQPLDNKSVIEAKKTLAETYKSVYELKLNKLTRGDKQFFLTNLSRNDCTFVNEFIKEVLREAEETFENPLTKNEI